MSLILATILLFSALSIALDGIGRQAAAPRVPLGGSSAYIDPYTGTFVGLGELTNDGIGYSSWSNVVIAFRFAPASGYFSSVFANVTITNPQNDSSSTSYGYEGNAGSFAYTYNVPPLVNLPFAVSKGFSVNSSTNAVDSFVYQGPVITGRAGLNWTGLWKPATLIVSIDKFQPVKNFTSAIDNKDYTRWAISGTALNNQTQEINNVHVVAGLRGSQPGIQGNYSLIGVAGYGMLAEEEMKMANQTDGLPFHHMAGFEKRNFTLYTTIPSAWKPTSAYSYAESEESVMYYQTYHPLVAEYGVKGISYVQVVPSGDQAIIPQHSNDTVTFTANITNTSNQDMQFDAILQIVKVNFSSKDRIQRLDWYIGNSTTEDIQVIRSSVKALNGRQIVNFSWHPTESGYYAHAIYLVSNLEKPSLLAFPFDYLPEFTYGGVEYSAQFIYVPHRVDVTSSRVANVTIATGSDIANGPRFDPQLVKVVIGVNSTVNWINHSGGTNAVWADGTSAGDPDFYGATHPTSVVYNLDLQNNTMGPNQSFAYTFTKPGIIQYHGYPFLTGTVIVLPLTSKFNNGLEYSFYDGLDKVPPSQVFHENYTGIDRVNGNVTIGNRTFYQTTLNPSMPTGQSTQFHNVNFILTGILGTPEGRLYTFQINFKDGSEEVFGKNVRFEDGSGTGSGIGILYLGPPALRQVAVTVLTAHITPQAGIAITPDGQIKLLVSTN